LQFRNLSRSMRLLKTQKHSEKKKVIVGFVQVNNLKQTLNRRVFIVHRFSIIIHILALNGTMTDLILTRIVRISPTR